jgi:pimeloyl-ACP methyl ester carboxylesterase
MRLIMPDLPGFGSSAAFTGTEHSVPGYGRFITDFMAALGLGPDTVLLGHSFGSIVASHFVAAHPGRRHPELILVNPIAAPALEGPKGLMTRLAVLYYEAAARLPPPARAGPAAQPGDRAGDERDHGQNGDKELRRFIHAQHTRTFPPSRTGTACWRPSRPPSAATSLRWPAT